MPPAGNGSPAGGRADPTAWGPLLVILLLAGGLRVAGLGWGLRHRPDWDERVFVENVWAMHAQGDLDHRYYEYPGLFLYLLHPVIGLLHTEGPVPATAYLAARGLVAAFAVLNVLLVHQLGTRLGGSALGLAAALFLAVSPVELDTSHMVRPDVVLATAVLFALWAQRGIGHGWRGDLVAGAALGAACGVKFTGALLAPSHLLRRLLAAGPRLRGLVLAGLVATATFVATSPYLFLHAREARRQIAVQMGAHYSEAETGARYGDHVAYYLGKAVESLGPGGTALFVLGAGLALANGGRRRAWSPLLLHSLTTILVMSSADRRYARHLVPTLGPLCLVAGLPVSAVAQRSPGLAVLLAVGAATPPLVESALYAHGRARPSTLDRAADWVASRARPGDLVLTDQADLGLPRDRVEVLLACGREDWDRRVFSEVDLAVLGYDAPSLRGRTPEVVFQPETESAGPRLAGYAVGPDDRVPAVAVVVQPGWLDASENRDLLPLVLDGRPDTLWTTRGPQEAGTWFALRLPAPRRLARIELDLGHRTWRHAQSLLLATQDAAGTWREVRAPSGRAPAEEQLRQRRGHAEVLLLDGSPVQSVRLELRSRGLRRWSFSELRVYARADATFPPAQ